MVDRMGVAPTARILQGSVAATAHAGPKLEHVLGVAPSHDAVLRTAGFTGFLDVHWWVRRELHPPLSVKSRLHRSQCFEPELVREPGIAPGASTWQVDTLLLRHTRKNGHADGSRTRIPTLKGWCHNS